MFNFPVIIIIILIIYIKMVLIKVTFDVLSLDL